MIRIVEFHSRKRVFLGRSALFSFRGLGGGWVLAIAAINAASGKPRVEIVAPVSNGSA